MPANMGPPQVNTPCCAAQCDTLHVEEKWSCKCIHSLKKQSVPFILELGQGLKVLRTLWWGRVNRIPVQGVMVIRHGFLTLWFEHFPPSVNAGDVRQSISSQIPKPRKRRRQWTKELRTRSSYWHTESHGKGVNRLLSMAWWHCCHAFWQNIQACVDYLPKTNFSRAMGLNQRGGISGI